MAAMGLNGSANNYPQPQLSPSPPTTAGQQMQLPGGWLLLWLHIGMY
jgi:hypothetical protein